MKFLLAVSSSEYSAPTLELGARIAQTFEADLGVIFIGEKPNQFYGGHISLAHGNMSRWDLHRPGIQVLRWAFSELQRLDPEDENLQEARFNPDNMVEESDRFRLVLPSTGDQQIDLILREGEIIAELRDEVKDGGYDLTIIGASQGKRRRAHDLLQYLPSSVLVVSELDLSRPYRLLFLVDDSEATQRAIHFGAGIAKRLGYPIRTLTVSKTQRFGPGYTGAAKAAKEYLEEQGLEVEQLFLTGDPVETFVEVAGEDHIMIMGASSRNPLKQMILGSKPIQTLARARGPMLIIR